MTALIAVLPAPSIDTREANIARDEAAIAAIAALQPADAFEAMLAAQIIGARAHATELLRLATTPGLPLRDADRSRAQAASLIRLANSGLQALQRKQALHEKALSAVYRTRIASANRPVTVRRRREAAVLPQPKRRTLH